MFPVARLPTGRDGSYGRLCWVGEKEGARSGCEIGFGLRVWLPVVGRR